MPPIAPIPLPSLQPPTQPLPDLAGLPPSIAASLARLAGKPPPQPAPAGAAKPVAEADRK
jgi:hypothetical protein